MMERINDPSSIDVFAMWRTQPADELAVNGISQKNKLALNLLFKATLSAAKKLEKFEVSVDDLLGLIEDKVKSRIAEQNVKPTFQDR